MTARAGYAFCIDGRTLLYGKGGAAWLHQRVDTIANSGELRLGGCQVAMNLRALRTGHGNGGCSGGWGRALAPGWTILFEYDYLNFGRTGVGKLPRASSPGHSHINGYNLFPPRIRPMSARIFMK